MNLKLCVLLVVVFSILVLIIFDGIRLGVNWIWLLFRFIIVVIVLIRWVFFNLGKFISNLCLLDKSVVSVS